MIDTSEFGEDQDCVAYIGDSNETHETSCATCNTSEIITAPGSHLAVFQDRKQLVSVERKIWINERSQRIVADENQETVIRVFPFEVKAGHRFIGIVKNPVFIQGPGKVEKSLKRSVILVDVAQFQTFLFDTEQVFRGLVVAH